MVPRRGCHKVLCRDFVWITLWQMVVKDSWTRRCVHSSDVCWKKKRYMVSIKTMKRDVKHPQLNFKIQTIIWCPILLFKDDILWVIHDSKAKAIVGKHHLRLICHSKSKEDKLVIIDSPVVEASLSLPCWNQRSCQYQQNNRMDYNSVRAISTHHI